MNSKQIKQAISKFRSADVSIIKDDAMRAKAQTLQAKQKGFTLLELLVVITLLAILSVGAMVAYEGIGATAKDTASANNIATAENMIRNFRAVEDRYPNQFDNLANVDGDASDGMMELLAPATKEFFGQWAIPLAIHTTTPAGTVYEAVAKSLNAVGIDELQAISSDATFDIGYVPNLALNESYPLTLTGQGSEIELNPAAADFGGTQGLPGDLAISIVPSNGDGVCTADGITLAENFNGIETVENTRLNLINDGLDDDECSLVIAVGIGKDVPGSTLGSKVAIATAPTATSANINPANNYARYVALFYLGGTEDVTGAIDPDDILPKARLIGVVDTEGRTIDQAIAGANAEG